MKNPLAIFGIVFVLAIGGMIFAQTKTGPASDVYNGLAQCIADSGAKFYGAFWCPHCQDQHKMFGKADEFLPYVECSTPDGQGQTQACEEAGITSYPTWVLGDGTELSGVQTPTQLAEATDCPLPE